MNIQVQVMFVLQCLASYTFQFVYVLNLGPKGSGTLQNQTSSTVFSLELNEHPLVSSSFSSSVSRMTCR